ncbi:MAG: H-NS histone family protein [Spirochaetia bacterium]|nr:H-NS histone family protein [Spirochaetia bacterium]
MSRLKQTLAKIKKLQKSAEKLRKLEVSKVIQDIKKELAAHDLTVKDLGGGAGKTTRRRKKAAGKKRGRKAKAKRGPKPGKKRGRKPGRLKAFFSRGPRKGFRVAAKYIDPDTKKTWSGRGLKPRWIADALGRGKRLEDFAV